ncbi:NfeD family protein [Photobacterium sp. DNB23_23_1]|uniref:Activity regulator of membrane protease YbbK n=1 Tax=Photobacterium pectinilyticum TaxID=2906793 RepID=A0ABT1N8B0_9GAMM|nr:NfeD family protein [Photobacterium sp. ZSDE20]MCQ1060961.1 hypothetical protein [Photobacterium sp. ZSDE20]MDD1828897.1 hypothetical protein [Photobacterium sp. ZSDE20]
MGFEQYIAEWLIAAGIALIIIEVALLGMSTIVLLIGGVSMILVGLSHQADLVQTTNLPITLAITIAVLMILSYRPLKKIQNKTDHKVVQTEFSNFSFYLESDVNPNSETTYRYSGIEWKLKSKVPISAGSEVKVVKMDVGVMWIVLSE